VAHPKSAEQIREMMKARAEAAKKSKQAKQSAGSSAAALAAAEAKKRPNEKKKSGPTYQTGGQNRGMKARGSDNKYQGE